MVVLAALSPKGSLDRPCAPSRPLSHPPLPVAPSPHPPPTSASSLLQLVLQEYRCNGGWKGLHVETGIHCSLFALLMWDLLFEDPPPDAFTSRFQDAPHDLALDGGEFAAARRPRLTERLDALRKMSGAEIEAEVRAVHASQLGVRCRGLSWQRWGDSVDELAEIAACLGGVALAAICECFAEDYGGWHGGMPDLIVWQRRPPPSAEGEAGQGDGERGDAERGDAERGDGARGDGAGDGACGGTRGGGAAPPARPSYGEARLVEVKSPSDKLSDQQRAWLHRLASNGVRVEVCRVVEDEDTDVLALRPSFAPAETPSQPPLPDPATHLEPPSPEAAPCTHAHADPESEQEEAIFRPAPRHSCGPVSMAVAGHASTGALAQAEASAAQELPAHVGVYRVPGSDRPAGSRLKLKRKSTDPLAEGG